MGMGWKYSRGGLWKNTKCKCGKGEVIINISDHEESDYPPFIRNAEFDAVCTCPNKCVDLDRLSQHELEHYE